MLNYLNRILNMSRTRCLLVIVCVATSLLLITFHYWPSGLTFHLLMTRSTVDGKSIRNNHERVIWISSNGSHTIKSYNRTYISEPLNKSYIEFTKKNTLIHYPYSSWQCSNTSNKNSGNDGQYCLLTNIYYNSATDQYHYYQNPSQTQSRDLFMADYGTFRVNIINDNNIVKQSGVSAILTRPIYVGAPVDPNYAHGFLETFGPRFWIISEVQSHPSFIDPTQIQIYYPSIMFTSFPTNWNRYSRQSDGTYRDTVKWAATMQSMFSIYPLLTYKSFNETTVMFKYLLLTGLQSSRTAAWNYHYVIPRFFRYHPFHTRQYRRAYLAYSEWMLKNLNLPSKFELTPVQRQLQENGATETFPICNPMCATIPPKTSPQEAEFTGEWIVVLNRAGSGRRELINANELVETLLKVFPDHSNPYLRVWPKQFNFNDDVYQTARMARSIRLLIGVHGAGLSNAVFMRPGAILYEINSLGCRLQSFNFRRWATVFNLQHTLWIPSVGRNGATNLDECDHGASITLVVSEIIDEVINLLQDEQAYRSGYLRRARDILNDTTLADCPEFTLE